MTMWNELLGNQILISAVLGWTVAQFLKTVIDMVINKSFNPERVFGSGGMPSSHSATVCALTTASGMKPSQTTTEVEVQERRKEDGKEKEAENVTVLPDSNGKLNGAYMQGLYGTQKQTVILVGYDGRVRYFERTLYEDDARATEIHRRDRSYEFVIEK